MLRIAVFSGSNWDVPEADSYSLLDEAIAAFAETHPGVQIEYESGIPKDEYEEWIAQCILRDDLPDILFVPSEYFSTLASTHALQPLDDFARADAAFQEERITRHRCRHAAKMERCMRFLIYRCLSSSL